MKRAYFDSAADKIALTPSQEILGALAADLPFALEPMQRDAWNFEIEHVKQLAPELSGAHFFFEFMIPRMGRRADVVLIYRGIVFVLEYKVGSTSHDRHALDQTYGYGLDLKHFHETSHDRRIVPILVATKADIGEGEALEWDEDNLCKPVRASSENLLPLLKGIAGRYAEDELEGEAWAQGRYKPTPTIIEAAQALYRGHDVDEISRSEAGAENLSKPANFISDVIERSKAGEEKSICFVTGVPGSGKTLAGLQHREFSYALA